MSLDSLIRRATLGIAAGIALFAGTSIQPTYAGESPTEAKKPEVSLYDLLFSHTISDRAHATETLLLEVHDQKTDAAAASDALKKLGDLEKVANARELGIPKDFFEAQRAGIRSIKPKEYQWAKEFNPRLAQEDYLAAVDNILSRMLQRLEEKWLESRGVKTPEGMVLIPAGSFIRGSDVKEAQYFEKQTTQVIHASLRVESPEPNQIRYFSTRGYMREPWRTNIVVPKSFWIDVTEVTNRAYQTYLKTVNKQAPYAHAGMEKDVLNAEMWTDGQTPPKGREERPYIFGSFFDAEAFAKQYGKRIPTENEWEYAARGMGGRIWPTGNKADSALLGAVWENRQVRGEVLSKVGSFPQGASPFRVLDMAGNGGQWVSIVYNLPVTGTSWDTLTPTTGRQTLEDYAVAKAYDLAGSNQGSESRSARGGVLQKKISGKVGFRCVMDIAPEHQYIEQPKPLEKPMGK